MYTESEFREIIKKKYPKYLNIYFDYKTTKSGKINENWRRVRNFQCIVYPDSMDGTLEECADRMTIPFVVGYHDKDILDKKTGEIKKPHYHLCGEVSGKTTLWNFYNIVLSAFGENSAYGFEITSDKNKSVRYLMHLDDKDKFQYDVSCISAFGGYNYMDSIKNGSNDFVDSKKRIKAIINENDIIFFNRLDDYLDEYEPALALALSSNRDLSKWCHEYIRGKEHDLYYDGKVEKGYTVTTFKNGLEIKSDKYQFNRKILKTVNE